MDKVDKVDKNYKNIHNSEYIRLSEAFNFAKKSTHQILFFEKGMWIMWIGHIIRKNIDGEDLFQEIFPYLINVAGPHSYQQITVDTII